MNTTTIDQVFQDQAAKLKAMGVSDQAADKVLLAMAIEFINTFMLQNAELKVRLDQFNEIGTELKAVKAKLAELTSGE